VIANTFNYLAHVLEFIGGNWHKLTYA
jgi:hypothetical protein